MLLDIPPRYMWGWGAGLSGYCGSASIQSVGIYFGNWLSQDTVRAVTGATGPSHEIELGSDGCCAAADVLRALRLNATQWPYWAEARPQAPAFLRWLAAAVDAAEPAIFGLYMKTETGSRFDHIVPLVGFGASGQQLIFNDLHANRSQTVRTPGFIRSRAQCRAMLPWLERFSYCLPDDINYGLRVHGNADAEGELLPTRLTMASRSEPDYSAEDGWGETPCLLTATLTASRLLPGQPYTLLRFDRRSAVPDRGFLLAGGAAVRVEFIAATSTQRWDVSFPSNSTIFYRVVRGTATNLATNSAAAAGATGWAKAEEAGAAQAVY
jgi:hypothetical protein